MADLNRKAIQLLAVRVPPECPELAHAGPPTIRLGLRRVAPLEAGRIYTRYEAMAALKALLRLE